MSNRRILLLIIASMVSLQAFSIHAASADIKPTRPNVVLIMTDNHGAWTLGCYGNKDIRTPHLDRMAREGMLFSRCYSSNAVCSPTRATWLTGLMPSQHGVHCFIHGSVQLGPKAFSTIKEFRSLPEVLSNAGYVCGLSGKWHLGDHTKPQEGFSFWVTKASGGSSEFYDQKIIEDGKVRTEPSYLTEYFTTRGIEFIEKNRRKPFFLFLAYNGPYGLSRLLLSKARNRHAKYYADKQLPSFPRKKMHPWLYNNRDYHNNITSMRRYAAEVSGVDDGVGRIFATLKKHGLDKNTLVIFTGDQGLAGGQSGIWGMGDHTRPLTAFDSTMHVPLIFHHLGRIRAGQRVDKLVSNYDFYPSILNYLGLGEKIPKEPRQPGRSYARILTGKMQREPWDDTVFYEFETIRAVRTNRWKYIEHIKTGPRELYDLKSDPGELKNLIAKRSTAGVRKKLRTRLHAFFKRHADPKYDLANGGTSKARFLISALPPVVRASFVDGSWTLDATTVQLKGKTLKVADDLRTIAGWKSRSDRATWSLSRVKAGTYKVSAEWAFVGGKLADDSMPLLKLNGKPLHLKLPSRLKSTGGSDKYRQHELGTVRLPAGNHTLAIGPDRDLKGQWLQLRSITLKPQSNNSR